MSRTAKQSKKRTSRKNKRHAIRSRSGHSCRVKLLKPSCSRKASGRVMKSVSSRSKLPGAARCFTEHTYIGVKTHATISALPPQNTSLLNMYTYGVVNRGKHPALVEVQISPNGRDYAMDIQEVVAAGQIKAIVPIRFLKYARLALQSKEPGQSTEIDVYFQAQRM